MKVRNTFIIFLVSGLWHGANWTFIAWGALNAIYFMPLLLTNNNRNNLKTVAQGKYLPTIKEFSFMIITFGLTVFAWIFFRAENISHAMSYVAEIFSESFFTMPEFPGMRRALTTVILVIGFVLVEWLGREQQYAIAKLGIGWMRPLRWGMYYGIITLILNFSGKDQQFIYFQF